MTTEANQSGTRGHKITTSHKLSSRARVFTRVAAPRLTPDGSIVPAITTLLHYYTITPPRVALGHILHSALVEELEDTPPLWPPINTFYSFILMMTELFSINPDIHHLAPPAAGTRAPCHNTAAVFHFLKYLLTNQVWTLHVILLSTSR